MRKTVGKKPEMKFEKQPIPQEELQREFDYALAQQVVKAMLESGLITEEECVKITRLNRRSFRPALAGIMS